MMKPVHVAVAVLRDPHQKFLIARRPENSHQGNLLEFPGGKVEPGESVEAALVREIREEVALDIQDTAKRPLIQILHHYPDKDVLLDVWLVDNFTGTPSAVEQQPLYRLSLNELDPAKFPAANRAIVQALRLPARMIMPGGFQSRNELLVRLKSSLAESRGGLVIRIPQVSREEYRHLWESCLTVRSATMTGAEQPWLLHGEHGLAIWRQLERGKEKRGVSGLHINAQQLLQLQQRPVGLTDLLGASCHNEEEIEKANQLGADYIFLSPVQSTLKYGQASPLGWAEFSRLVALAKMPVYALGGMSSDDVSRAQYAGGQGIAAIGAFWECL